nr:MAG TPA: pKID domain [Caudoviricetes sp.]
MLNRYPVYRKCLTTIESTFLCITVQGKGKRVE